MDYKALYEALLEHHQFMLSQISHEIRNPVTIVNSFLQILESNHPELLKDNCWIKIMDNMDLLKALLNELSEYNNSSRLNLKSTNIFYLAEDIIDSLRPSLSACDITISLIKETALPLIPADAVKIRQILMNLIRNAKEAIGNHGTIICRLAFDGEYVAISVKDNGCGIPLEYQSDLFEPFITHKSEGTGLGLPICKRIVEAHHGKIFFISDEEKGTTFTILLPVG